MMISLLYEDRTRENGKLTKPMHLIGLEWSLYWAFFPSQPCDNVRNKSGSITNSRPAPVARWSQRD